MMQKTPCNLDILGKPLYSFLSYIKDDRLPYFKNGVIELKRSLLGSIDSISFFNRISYTTLLSICAFSRSAELQDGELNIIYSFDFNNLRTIFEYNDADSIKIKNCFINAGIYSIYHKHNFDRNSSYHLAKKEEITDELFRLSMIWDFNEIINHLILTENNALIYKTKDNICLDLLSKVETEINQRDFKNLTLKDKYEIAILKFNLIAIRLLSFNRQKRAAG